MERHSIGAPCSATPAASATAYNHHEHIYSGPSRRALLAGMAALPLSACPAPVPAAGVGPAGVSPALSALIAAADAAMADFNHYRAGVYDPAEEREVRARLAGDTPQPIPDNVTRRDTDLLAAVTSAEWAVANHPVATPTDFHAKVSFMAERQMFEGINHAALMLADAARLTGMEARS